MDLAIICFGFGRTYSYFLIITYCFYGYFSLSFYLIKTESLRFLAKTKNLLEPGSPLHLNKIPQYLKKEVKIKKTFFLSAAICKHLASQRRGGCSLFSKMFIKQLVVVFYISRFENHCLYYASSQSMS